MLWTLYYLLVCVFPGHQYRYKGYGTFSIPRSAACSVGDCFLSHQWQIYYMGGTTLILSRGVVVNLISAIPLVPSPCVSKRTSAILQPIRAVVQNQGLSPQGCCILNLVQCDWDYVSMDQSTLWDLNFQCTQRGKIQTQTLHCRSPLIPTKNI